MSNVLLDTSFTRCLLIDFGTGNFWCPGQALNTLRGSVEYAAPELFNRVTMWGPGIDVWSFGIVIFGMLFGLLPFQLQMENLDDLAGRILRGLTDAHHRAMKKHISFECQLLISSCLDLNPLTRITMTEVARHSWITGKGKYPVELIDQNKNLDVKQKIARLFCDRLKVPVSVKKIIQHVTNRPFHTNGGCFNLLMQEYLDQGQDAYIPAPKLAIQQSGSSCARPAKGKFKLPK
jgi:serine/threonine protein kinase